MTDRHRPCERLAETTLALSLTDIVRYQGASNDYNPLHHDESCARAAGLDGVVSVGMLQAGILANLAADRLGPENVRSLSFRFRDTVAPGESMRFVVMRGPHDGTIGTPGTELSLACETQSGRAIVGGGAFFACGR